MILKVVSKRLDCIGIFPFAYIYDFRFIQINKNGYVVMTFCSGRFIDTDGFYL